MQMMGRKVDDHGEGAVEECFCESGRQAYDRIASGKRIHRQREKLGFLRPNDYQKMKNFELFCTFGFGKEYLYFSTDALSGKIELSD